MIRASAKNFKFVTVVVNPARYDQVAEMIKEKGETTEEFRMRLAKEAFEHTADYDAAITRYISEQLNG